MLSLMLQNMSTLTEKVSVFQGHSGIEDSLLCMLSVPVIIKFILSSYQAYLGIEGRSRVNRVHSVTKGKLVWVLC